MLLFVFLQGTREAIRADELDCWIWRSPRPSNQEIQTLIHGKGMWVGLGLSGTVVTSFDGLNWDLSNVGESAPVAAAAFGNGLFLASVFTRGLYASIDAHNWVQVPSGPSLSDIVYGAGRFVGVAGTGDIWTSTNGFSWTSTPVHHLMAFTYLSFANGLFFAIDRSSTDRNAYFISADGLNWPSQYFLGTNGIDKVVYGNGAYVSFRTALIFTSSSFTFRCDFMTSTDGATWTPPVSFAGYDVRDMIFANGQFFAIESSGRILTSTNGASWTEYAAPSLLAASRIGWAEGTFVSASSLGSLASSTDGVNWTRRSVGPQSSLLSLARLNDRLIAVGGSLGDGGGNISKSIVVTSDNGRDWTEHDPGTTNSLAAVTFGSGRYAAVGAAGTVSTSLDAASWGALPSLTSNTLNGVAYGNGRFVAIGGDATRATILHSTDGVNWFSQGSAATIPTLHAIVFGQGQFIAVGRTNNSRQATILSSPDGLAWTPRLPTSTNTLRAVAYGGDVFVATGDRGAILHSTNGTNWTNLSRNTSSSLRGVAYGGGWWMILTDGQYTSPDGLNWTFRSALRRTTASTTYGIAFGGDSFFVVGPWGQILETLPFHPSPQDTALRLHYGNASFLTITGPACRRVWIESSNVLLGSNGASWQPLTSVSNHNGTVILPIDPPTNLQMQFYRAVVP